MLLIGFRVLLNGEDGVFLSQLQDARTSFPKARLIAAICGCAPSESIRSLCDDIIYYSDQPLGLTKPFDLLVEYARSHDADRLILVDGDDQFIFSELRRLYDASNRSSYDAIIPIRRKKSLFFSDDGINRVLVEDCENLIFSTACPNDLKDPQPGAIFLLTKKAISSLSLGTVPAWIGDLAVTAQLIKANCSLCELEMDIREQQMTHMTLNRELLKIRQLEHYFGVRLMDVLPDKAKYAPVKKCYSEYIHDRPCG